MAQNDGEGEFSDAPGIIVIHIHAWKLGDKVYSDRSGWRRKSLNGRNISKAWKTASEEGEILPSKTGIKKISFKWTNLSSEHMQEYRSVKLITAEVVQGMLEKLAWNGPKLGLTLHHW